MPLPTTASVDLLYAIAQVIVSYMDQMPSSLPAMVIGVVVVTVPLTLLHETGHAWAARRLLDVDVEISVGDAGKFAEFQLGRVRAELNALSGLGSAGWAEFDAGRATARDILLISLAGPGASLVGFVTTAYLLSLAVPGTLIHVLLWSATTFNLVGALNVIPFRYRTTRSSPVLRSDGMLALEALAVIRMR